MDQQRRLLLHLSIFIAVCLRIPLTNAQNSSTEVGLPLPQSAQSRTNITIYAWSSWGTWSACSRTCGGGVSVQERHCLPRDPTRWRRSRKRRKLVRSTDRMRRTRNANTDSIPDCPGLARRYHECNTMVTRLYVQLVLRSSAKV
ncbi:ADAMTS-like protein 2 [Melitaea cinxia]|uniref:ADAMTS-like protein 2 n=1 Tax=Melitaea cinxia TaxID=113334 RepID=UPI001E2708BC|nr:ADAMTS-like protein 2 [Melitaea cinxia]